MTFNVSIIGRVADETERAATEGELSEAVRAFVAQHDQHVIFARGDFSTIGLCDYKSEDAEMPPGQVFVPQPDPEVPAPEVPQEPVPDVGGEEPAPEPTPPEG